MVTATAATTDSSRSQRRLRRGSRRRPYRPGGNTGGWPLELAWISLTGYGLLRFVNGVIGDNVRVNLGS